MTLLVETKQEVIKFIHLNQKDNQYDYSNTHTMSLNPFKPFILWLLSTSIAFICEIGLQFIEIEDCNHFIPDETLFSIVRQQSHVHICIIWKIQILRSFYYFSTHFWNKLYTYIFRLYLKTVICDVCREKV